MKAARKGVLTENLNELFQSVREGLTTIIVAAGLFAGFWKFAGKKAWDTVKGVFERLGSLEESAEFAKAATQDGFKDLRVAFDEGQSETIKRLDHINGSLGEHERSLHAHETKIAVLKAERDAEQRVWESINTTARISGGQVTLGHSVQDASPDEDDDLDETV